MQELSLITRAGLVKAAGTAVLTLLAATSIVPTAKAEPGIGLPAAPATSKMAPDGSRITEVHVVNDRHLLLTVYSSAMNSEYRVKVDRAADTSVPRPVLYLLSGGSGGIGQASWDRETGASEFLTARNVNVVQPLGGAGSYYTDWRMPDPHLGVQKWRTYLTEELPPLIDGELGTTGVNAIAGVSMSGTSVLQLPIAKPGLYKAVASYSGCAAISDPLGQAYVRLTSAYSGGNVANMYGPPDDPMWIANDPYVNAAGLRGMDIYLSSGNGIPGPYDHVGDRHLVGGGGEIALANQILVGGVVELAVDQCTQNLAARLADLGIPATVERRPYGTHSWGYWDDELKASWPVLAHGLGL
ncbi:alpha/beta hydrolase [Nocardia vinacea]|uniref:alpha/beta hydrolase n=1 Tax=Nocardia vinacea TaxID=96468 RepID=UPI00030BEA37|nr:alpha/beta hydrolase family protein [Nocardia vinacea]